MDHGAPIGGITDVYPQLAGRTGALFAAWSTTIGWTGGRTLLCAHDPTI